MGIYVIKQGDTGGDIAKAQGLTLAQLFAANPGVNWENLPAGYHIHVPGNKTTQYQIVAGDSGRLIAGRLGIPFNVLENLNPGTIWTALEPGKFLTVPASETLLKDSIGAPISGVPAQMPPPAASQGTRMTDATRKKVTELLGGSEDNTAAFSKVNGLDWVGCFALILSYVTTQTQPAGGPLLAIVDLRDLSWKANDNLVVPWKIPASLPMPCTEGKPNAKVFDDAAKGKGLAVLFSGWKELREVIFVDTHGHGRAPEIATRYAQWLLKTNTGKAAEPKIFFMTGGLAAYCNAQCFGRVLLNAPNAFVTGWPKILQ